MNRGVIGGVLCLLAFALTANAQDRKLVDAVKRQDQTAVTALIKGGANVNAALPDGATVLHWAAYNDDLPMAEALITAGANVGAVNQLGVTPLHLACGNGSAAMVELLLKAGADPNGGTAGRETPVMTAARVGQPAVMKQLLAKGGNASASEASRGQTALMWAAAQRHPDVVQLLLSAGANVKARTTVPPRRGRGMVVSEVAAPPTALPARGAGAEGSNGFTALLFAARSGDIESAKLLLDAGADINGLSADGMSPLLLSTQRAFPKFAQFLLDKGADPNLANLGYTPLHWAVGTWETELTVRAITVERQDVWSTVAGLKAGKLDLVKALLAHGADPNGRMDKAPTRVGSSKNPDLPELLGATPLILAAMAGDVPVMETLRAAGANPALKTWTEGTVLMAAVGFGHVQGEDFIKDADTRAAAELALAMGADVNDTDTTGNTALHYAAYMRHDASVKLLVERGADLNLKNYLGETPLWLSELVIQFMAGGTYQMIPSSTSDLLRQLGAKNDAIPYAKFRPADWPSNYRPKGENAGEVETPEASSPAKR
jgi:ankyrin repeat protein